MNDVLVIFPALWLSKWCLSKFIIKHLNGVSKNCAKLPKSKRSNYLLSNCTN